MVGLIHHSSVRATLLHRVTLQASSDKPVDRFSLDQTPISGPSTVVTEVGSHVSLLDVLSVPLGSVLVPFSHTSYSLQCVSR